MLRKHCGIPALVALCFVCTTAPLQAAQLLINNCDSTTGWTTDSPASVSVVSGAGATNALRVAFAAASAPNPGGGPSPGALRLQNTNDDPFYPASGTDTYGGVRFWVRGDASTQWGNIQFRYGKSWTRAWALFPVTSTWTEITVPWREFFQQNFDGTMDTHYKEVFLIEFTSGFSQTYGHPLSGLPAQAYEIDDIRLVDGVNLPSTPLPQGNSIKNTVNKMNAQQPVTIVVMGASISWGLQTANPAQDHWPGKLESLLRNHFGYSGITVVNAAVPGFNSFEGACATGAFIFGREPVDLVMAADWCYNDFPDTDQQAFGISQIAKNYEAFFGLVLRRGNSEVMHIQSGLHCEAGQFDRMDGTNTALSDLCDIMNIFKADMYGTFKALGQPWLTANYYTIAGDYAHYNATAHTRVSEIVFDAIKSVSSVPAVSFDAASSGGSEAVTAVSIPVSLSAASGQTVAVNYAVTGGSATGGGVDYTLASGTLSFNAGVTAQNIAVAIVNDSVYEPDETIQITLSSPANATLGATTAHTYTINNNDPQPTVAFNAAASSGAESVTSASIPVTLSNPSYQAVTVAYAVTGGSATGGGVDYTLASGTLTFNPGVTAQSIAISVLDDGTPEANETIIVALSSPANATLGTTTTHTYTILDDDTPPTVSFVETSSSGAESAAAVSVPVALSNPYSQAVTVAYAVTGGTATGGGVDYTRADGTLTFNPGVTTQSIAISVVDDAVYEDDETVQITLSNPVNASLGANAGHTYTILDNEPLPIVPPVIASPASATATQGEPFTYRIVLASETVATFAASGLPPGLSLSGDTISGTPTVGGDVYITLTATNAAGSGSATIHLVIAKPAGTTDTPPTISSPPTASPPTGTTGQTATFAATGSDGDGDMLSYTWDFGDGTPGTGATVSHVYAAPGIYTVTVTISDGTATTQQQTDFAVSAADVPVGEDNGGDDKWDAQGLDTFRITKVSVKFNFASGSKDAMQLSGTVPVAKFFKPASKKVTVLIGGFRKDFTLNAKGQATAGASKLQIKGKMKKGVFKATPAKFTLTVKGEPLLAALQEFGFANTTTAKAGEQLEMSVIIMVDTLGYEASQNVLYKATTGKNGSGKLQGK